MPAQIKHEFRYFIYCRKSTEDEEKQQLSIPAQITELKQFAAQNNYQVLDILTETKTAKAPGRKFFNQMLRKIETGEANGILAWHPDRLARNAVDAGQIGQLLNIGKLLDLKFPSFWFEKTPQGIFMLNMAFSQSQYFSDALSVNTVRGLKAKCRTGWFPGMAPHGYQNDRLHKTIKVDSKKGPLITKMFEVYAKDILNYEQTAKRMFQLGLISRTGKMFRKDEVKKVLTNQFYIGRFYYMGEFYEGKHQPLVTKELFDRVHEIVVSRSRPRHTKSFRPFAFTGLMKCGHCGMSITAEIKTKRYLYGRTQKFIYYHCSRRNKKIICRQPFTRQAEIDRQLSEAIRSVALTQAEANWFFDKINQKKQTEQIELKSVIKGFGSGIEAIKLKLERLVDLYLSGEIERNEYRKRKRELVFAKRGNEDKILKFQNQPTSWFEPMESWVKLALQAKKTAEATKPLSQKRDFLLKTGSDLTLKDKKVEINWPIPWAALGAAATDRQFEPKPGIGPGTCCLRYSRSAN